MKTLGSLVAQMVKNPSAMRETWVQSVGWDNPLEEVRATHSSILAWRNSWTEEPGKSWTHTLMEILVFKHLIHKNKTVHIHLNCTILS